MGLLVSFFYNLYTTIPIYTVSVMLGTAIPTSLLHFRKMLISFVYSFLLNSTLIGRILFLFVDMYVQICVGASKVPTVVL